MHDGVQPVRDHKRGAALAQMLDGDLHQPLRFGIECGGGFIQQDDRRVLDQRTRNSNTLALAARELRAMFAHGRIVAARKTHDEVMRIGGFCGGDDFILGRAGLSERDIVADAGAEQIDILPDIGGLRAQRMA